ncbi:MAG: hypothetical protein K6E68_07380 [Lachnospiraceae bacterium]|nr:hypothetical protein [Lachnospiraceae bacterium]
MDNWVLTFYIITFLLSILLSGIYLTSWDRHYDPNMLLVFMLVPIVDLGYMMLARAQSLDAALFGNQITYIGGCYLLPFIMFSTFKLCNFGYNIRINSAIVLFNTLIYLSSLTIGVLPIFYKTVDFRIEDGVIVLVKTYGPIHTVFYAMMIVYFMVSLGVSLYTLFNKADTSNKIVFRLLLTQFITISAFFGGRMITKKVEFVPLAYVFDQLVYLTIANKMCLYDVMDTGIESLVQSGDTGLVSFDFKYRYLASNKTARNIFPDLFNVRVDTSIEGYKPLEDTILNWIKEYEKNPSNNKFLYKRDERNYFVEINILYNGKHKSGYQLFVKDNTREQEYIAMLNKYNSNLQTKLDEIYSQRENKETE